jgi:hypothetical protein
MKLVLPAALVACIVGAFVGFFVSSERFRADPAPERGPDASQGEPSTSLEADLRRREEELSLAR